MTATYSVTMSGTCSGDDCGITVTATGSGIPEEHRPDREHRLGEHVTGLRCICGNEVVEARVVGVALDPFMAMIDPDENEPANDEEAMS